MAYAISELLPEYCRQKAEIKALIAGQKTLQNNLSKTIRAETIKEFVERLKVHTIEVDVSFGYGREHYTEAVATIAIDNLVKELVGDFDE